jgi:predicted helicase
VTDFILEHAKQKYGPRVSKEDIFYYVYGILHSQTYREKFSADLKKTLPRLPLVSEPKKFWDFSKAGRDLAELHLGYEDVPPCPGVEVTGDETGGYEVRQMRFPSKDRKDTILYNASITVSGIPAKAYEYVVNGKSAIEWVMERYAVTVDRVSGIKNDPNDWAKEHNKPRYILDLLLSVINVSIQTVDIMNALPEVDWDRE